MRLDDGDYWIDDYGSWNQVEFGQLCPFSPDPVVRDRQGLDFAFRRLGMVRVSKRHSTITVQWDIAKVSRESLASASSLLWDLAGVRRTKLRYYFGGWTYEIFDSLKAACERLDALWAYRTVIPFPGVRTLQLGQSTRMGTATPIIENTRRLLSKNKRRIDSHLWSTFADRNLSGRILLFKEEDDGSWLSYHFIGRNSLFAQVFGTGVLGNLVGQHCAVDPSENRIGYSASRSYTQILASAGEHVDQVFMPIKHDDDDGIWVSYQRMITACKDRRGRNMLLVLADYTEESLIAA